MTRPVCYALGLATGTYRGQPFANRQPLPFHPDTANFESTADRVLLASIGIFSCDTTAHRAKRDAQAGRERMTEAAYLAVGLDRRAEHAAVARNLKLPNSGIWVTSTGEYAAACAQRDQEIVDLVYTGGHHA